MQELMDNLRKSVEAESVSFIIGAGFSRNISQQFPLWGELLKPLVLELYPECNKGSEKKKEERVRQAIAEKTYLGIASEYVHRIGYLEAIDLHIESVMPYLKRRDDGGYDLMINEKIVDHNPSLECHRKLLSLNAKHIFTFNYDNALEILANVDASSQLWEQQVCADNKAHAYTDLLTAYKLAYATLNESVRCHQDKSDIGESDSNDEKIDFSRINAIVDKIDLDLDYFCDSTSDIQALYQQHIEIVNREIERQKNRIRQAKEQRMSLYQLITNSYQISLTDECKNIYKLHGNLRTKPDDKYEFDGDKHMQYVITQEDYDTYPQKHEAFVNLMRISLLKGSFCLIGFSCDDPNFMGWINWVKDILDDSNSRLGTQSRFIYYINADDKHLPASKELLLKNHYIKVIDLRECFPDAGTQHNRILKFLDYLSVDKNKSSVYNECWGKINTDKRPIQADDDFVNSVNRIYDLVEYNRLPDQFRISHYYRTTVFSRLASILESSIEPIIQSKLIYSAIKGELMPVGTILSTNQINRLSKASAELKLQYSRLVERDQVLSGALIDNKLDDCAIYESVLSLLFNLRFDDLERQVDNWSPSSGIYRMRRLMLQSIYKGKLDTSTINGLISPECFTCVQDYRYALDLLPQIRGVMMEAKGGGVSVYEDLRKQMESVDSRYPHLIKYREQIDGLLDGINKSKFKPFGNIKESFSLGSYNVPLVNSTKILQILIELAIPTQANHTILFNKEKWVIVFEKIYERYPQPCLLFSLLYGNDKDLLQRIAQHYIYSIKLAPIMPKLLKMMLSALNNQACPLNVKEAIYIVAPVFMQAVKPECWQIVFEEFYDSCELEQLCEGRMNINGFENFIVNGVKFSNSSQFKHKVLLQTLKLKDKISDVHNRLIIAASKDTIINQQESMHLKLLLESAQTPTQMYVLMNMNKWIGRDLVAEKLCSLDDHLYNDCTLIEAASEYAQNNSCFQAKLKKIILNSSRLWQTGISKDRSSVSHLGYTLDICEIQQYVLFDDVELKHIYTKLKCAYEDIEAITRKWNERHTWSFFSDWSYVLVEMRNFLIKNKSVLCVEKDYRITLRAISKLLSQGRGGNSISSLLLDDERSNKAISWLTNEVYYNGVKRYKYEYILVINKILSRDSRHLNSLFVHLGWSLSKYESEYDQTTFKPFIKSILDLYKRYFIGPKERNWDLEFAEKNVVERELCKIYNVYKSWGGNIRFWEKYTPRYY